MSGPSNNPSVFDEPQFRGGVNDGVGDGSAPSGGCWRCGYSLSGLKRAPGVPIKCPECGAGEFDSGGEGAEAADQTVWDEPGLSKTLAGETPEGAVTYAGWLREKLEQTNPATTWWMTLCVALMAGPWGLVGAVASQFAGGGNSMLSLFGLVLLAPLTEEVMKIAAVTWAVERRPYWFGGAGRMGGGQLLLCCGAGGLVFAAIENVLYLEVYIAEPDAWIVWWRWTVCVALHVCCSLIAGLGLRRVWLRCVTRLERPDLTLSLTHLGIAIGVHGTYNLLVTLLEFA